MEFVEFQNVSKIYTMGNNKIHAADGVTFSIKEGEFCVIVGAERRGQDGRF